MNSSLQNATLCLLGTLLTLTLFQGQAEAQIAPRVMILFDTSGSMIWDTNGNATHGDGSEDHPGLDTNGDNIPNDSKMFVAKEAVREILLESNAEIEFGLMRFHQDEGINILNEGADGPRYREPINYYGWDSCDNDGGADVLVDIGPNSRQGILGWLDGREDFPNDKELRGTGWTPLALSLQDARDHFSGGVIPDDNQRDCRNYFVIMLTDGVRECPNGTPDRDPVSATANLRTVQVNGQDHDIKTFIIGFGPNVNGSDQLNRMARAGGTSTNDQGAIDLVAGEALFANNRARLREVLTEVLVAIEPAEVCDGRDNDCDNLIDEDFPTLGDRCEAGIGECLNTGEMVCTPSGTSVQCSAEPGQRGVEVCDGDDNDCDNLIDEGTFNECGSCGAIPVELCDGEDNDCDGREDEGLLNSCGECGPTPAELCNGIDDDCDNRFDEGILNECGDCGPTPREVCDGEDNDCDNLIDEGFDDNCGDCTPTGPEICDGDDNDCDAIIDEGVLNDCGECGPVPNEVCNDLDDDCDGDIDEGVINDCGVCGQVDTEICNFEDDDCDGDIDEGTENACRYCGGLPQDTCDNVDNDCNGGIDDNVVCPNPNQTCVNGECADRCQAGECFNGRICRDGFCVLPCSNADCPQGHVCQNGVCADACLGIECRPGLRCSLGRCVEEDCYNAGCPENEVCLGGACVDDPCAEVQCLPTQGCRDGGCFDTCLDVDCPDGQRCERGVCFDDPCAGRVCTADRVCVNGICIEDPCASVICDPGLTCSEGACVDDPCLRTTCPDGTTCRRGDCILDDDDGGQVDTGEGEDQDPEGGITNNGNGPDGAVGSSPAGPEACACQSPARPVPWPAPGFLLLVSAALIAANRRR